jgi:hypothetical protein
VEQRPDQQLRQLHLERWASGDQCGFSQLQPTTGLGLCLQQSFEHGRRVPIVN